MIQIKNDKQTPVITPGDFLISVTPEAIEWNPVYEGVEIAVISGDPNKAGSPFVIRVKHRDGIRVAPHWHSFDENITVISGTWVSRTKGRWAMSYGGSERESVTAVTL